jgi:hypothetical protein
MIEEESERLDPTQKVADQAASPSIERAILDYGKATGYASLVVDGISIGMGSSAWYRFVWMPGPTREQRQAVYNFVVQQSPPRLAG